MMNAWGRIFFIHDQEAGTVVKGQPLENHVGNCRRLLEHFQPAYFHASTKDRLLQAVEQHDEGKRETFRIVQKELSFSYSFSGHRFRVPGNDPYIDALIRSHHAFSVEQINRERAKFEAESEERRYFADDLYLLCMADQLEAELAVKRIENASGGLPRTFMEFVTEQIADQQHDYFSVIPWPFLADEFTLIFSLRIPERECLGDFSAKTVQQCFEKSRNFAEEQVEILLRRL
ncbi:MAG: hypothetical protein RBT80_27465 [Candidatus Vecturithrix sp.]|jgi:CRISPR-associated endonuclease/helicase Cas3|nr:hypothetical protein [Candidatus Vecturithrix sp.]